MQSQNCDSPLQKRIALQEKAKQAYIQTCQSSKPYSIAFYMGTGIGKTKTSIDCAKWYLDNISQGKVLIVCHAEIGRDNIWPKELEQWAAGHPVQQAERICYQSLPKMKNRRFAVMIMDEAHYLTVRGAAFFDTNTVESLIVLTATPPRDLDKRLRLDHLVGNNMFRYTADQAIADGILNEYNVNVFMVKLDETDPYCTFFDDGRMYTEKECYLKHCERLTRCNELHISPKNAYVDMMRFLGNTRTKTKAAKYLANNLRANKRRFLTFCASIEQTSEISDYTYHSKISNADYLRFQNMEIDELASVRQIQEGANIPLLDRAIAIQLDTNPLNMIQKIGRLLRLEVGASASLFLIIFEKTFDEGWKDKALKQTPKHKVKTYPLTV